MTTNAEQDERLDSISRDVSEIKDALLGTYEKKGFISRLRGLEMIINKQMWGLGIVFTAIVGVITKGILG